MNDSAKLRRHLHLIRSLDTPYRYPSLQALADYLCDHDVDPVSTKTVERDLRDIRADYNITVTYNRREHGYFLDRADDENLDDFRDFVRLLERRERLAILTQSGRSVRRYLQLEHQDRSAAAQFRGLDWLTPIWNALERRLVVAFRYSSYDDSPDEQRLIEPGLLFEYKNRWYIDGYDLNRRGERTFGLDRISDLELTTQTVQPDRAIDYRENRQHVIGVTAPPGTPVERVVLRFAKREAEYVRSLPMHSSQKIVNETATYVDVQIQVILNHELQREILAYGELVEVLEPLTLREAVVGRVKALQVLYANPKGS